MQKLRRQYADILGGIIFDPLHNRDISYGLGPPTNGLTGFNPGSLYLDETNANVYKNAGTLASSTWVQLNSGGGLTSATVNTAITTVGAGTLTAASIIGGVITRSGSVAAYTDTTDTAALIIAALPAGTPLLTSWWLVVRNTVGFNETVAGGVGVTVSGNAIVPPNSVGYFLVTYATATTVTILGTDSGPLTTQPPAANTAISTVGAGTLTAAALVGGVITRTGSVAAYSDTVDTAANIIAALPNGNIGQSWYLTIKNTVAFNETILTAAGVTLSGQVIIPPNSVGTFLLTYNGAGTVTMQGLEIAPMTTMPLITPTSLSTVGAGTVTAAGIAGGVTNRTGSTSAYTDTLDTTANIIAALPNANPGQSFWWTYYNNTTGNATLAAGDGSTTITGTGIPQTCWASYLITVVTASTITVKQFETGPNVALPASQFTTAALSSSTASAGQLTGANFTTMANSAANPGTLTPRTASQMFTDIPNCQVGFNYILRLFNNQGTGVLTLGGAPTGVTFTGTMTVAINSYRDFNVSFPTSSTCTIQSLGVGGAGP